MPNLNRARNFGLASIMQCIEQHSADKYGNLSETFQEFKDRSSGL